MQKREILFCHFIALIAAKGLHWNPVFKRHYWQCVVQIETILMVIGDPPGSLSLYRMSRLEIGAWMTLRAMILLRTKLFSSMSNVIMGDI